MSPQSLAGLLILAFAIAAANLPFMSERLFGAVRLARPKTGWMRIMELVVGYFLTIGFGLLVEGRFGPIYPQRWEFWGITVCLFIVLGYPGFVWRYLRRPMRPADPSAGDPVREDRDGSLGRPQQPRA